MVVSGAPEPCEDHAEQISDAALAMLNSAKSLHLPHAQSVSVKIGDYELFIIIINTISYFLAFLFLK